MQYVVDIRQGSIRHVVSGILAVAPVSPPTSLQPLQTGEMLENTEHKCSGSVTQMFNKDICV